MEVEFKEMSNLFKKEVCYRITHTNLEKLLSNIFKINIKMFESYRGSEHRLVVNQVPNNKCLKKIEKILKNGTIWYWQLDDVFGWLLYNNYIHVGNFLIEVVR